MKQNNNNKTICVLGDYFMLDTGKGIRSIFIDACNSPKKLDRELSHLLFKQGVEFEVLLAFAEYVCDYFDFQ